MKKIFALILALAMLLSCTAAFADAAPAEEAPVVAAPSPVAGPLTIHAKTTIDREVLAVDLAVLGLDETAIAIADAFAAVLTESAERLTIADGGMQWDLILKDKDILSVAGKATDKGLTLGSSIIPSYTLDFSVDEISTLLNSLSSVLPQQEAPKFDVNALLQAVTTHVNTFVETAFTAVKTGEPQEGDFEMDGVHYNMCVPIDVDMVAIAKALNQMEKDLLADPTVAAAIAQYDKSGKYTKAAEKVTNPDTAPTVHLDAYMTVDDQGNQSGPVDTAFYIVDINSEDPFVMGDVLVDGENVTINVNYLTAATTAVVASTKLDNGHKYTVDVYANEVYYGCAAEVGTDENGVRYNDADIYFLDDEKPLVCVHTTMAHEGELTYDLEGKDSITLTDLTAKDGKAFSNLAMDAMMKGLGGILTAATEAMPDEVGALMALFQISDAA